MLWVSCDGNSYILYEFEFSILKVFQDLKKVFE